MQLSLKHIGFFLIALLFSLSARADKANIAVAANFTAPMKAIAEAFQGQTGHQLRLSFGSSGKLFAQIQNGAPYDAFLSADAGKPAKLVSAGLAVADSCFTYARGTLALWGLNSDARALLDTQSYRRLAIANPRLAPYGAAARDVLKHLGYYDAAAEHLVTGENIAQTYQFVATGNAEIGFVALSQIMRDGEPPAGAWIVPEARHRPINQDAVLLTRGADNEAAKSLLAFLRSDTARAIMRRYGYQSAGA